MIADASLLILYAVALLLCRSKLAFAALAVASLSALIGSNANMFEPWSFHAVHALLFTALALSKERLVRLSAFSMVVFQYIMAWDAFIFAAVETVLYQWYSLISFCIHLAIIYSVSKTWSSHAANSSADCNPITGRVNYL